MKYRGFKNVDDNIEATSAALTNIQKQYDKYSFSEELLQFEFDAYGGLDRLLHQQDTFLRGEDPIIMANGRR